MREQIDRAFEILRDCFKCGGKLLLCGNGGSAADCEHIVGELMKGMSRPRPVLQWPFLQGALPAISLCSHMGLITAIANDIGADWIFAQQVWGYGKLGDTLMGISTSGKSTNIINAFRVADRYGLVTIGLTGPYTEEFDEFCDIVISCPGRNTADIQERHIKAYHELCRRLEEEFFP